MLPIVFAALCVVTISAESSSINSYSSGPSSTRDYEYSGSGYSNEKPNYGDLGSTSFVTSSGSPYSKSDSLFVSDSSTDSGDPRASLTSSFYKSKFGSEAVVNAIRPSSSSSSGSVTSSAPLEQAGSRYINGGEYPQGNSAGYYENNGGAGGVQPGASSASEYPGSYASAGYRERGPSEHYRQPSEYSQSRPIYSGYSGVGEYTQLRPTSYSHGNPMASALVGGEYPSAPHHHLHQHQQQQQQNHHHHREYPYIYKTYVTSSTGGSSSGGPSSKYQTVLGALKSLFTGGGSGGSDPASSATHVPAYYSSNSAMHAAAHHGPTYSQSAPTGPGYYFASGPGVSASGSLYSKSYPTMRFMSSGTNASNKIIVIRDNGSTHSSSYSNNGGSITGASSSYPAKSKISNFAPSNTGYAYVAGSPSVLGYTSGSSSGYPGGYSNGASFTGSHGGSTFLGYSA
ncbi:PREDICTED: uncharacterized transmembrane protein DDB_G0289901-like isoform X2 [Ceratosolen solmsi marchali]|uniref:Uncharacterized transmembrane protein DDB_G0289901-like isoform X2 n=1 Tax=Ceratosolen solmsi marchali TaxID=326594 RepID=A0AAJ6YB35_9HYME|nr:PREDICTED: uncharacterized transmembrane protein DDB_G0289901-like isoform X2 [Ceratosolen solmsi marchali]